MPKGIEGEPEEDEEQISYFKKRAEIKKEKKGKYIGKGNKDWVQKKKDRQRRQGKDVREDSKYSGRKRKGHGVY